MPAGPNSRHLTRSEPSAASWMVVDNTPAARQHHVLLEIVPYYWQRYRQLLVQKNLSGQVIATMDVVTDRILGLLQNPKKPSRWDRRGMVVGHVQSGKTANYIGLIAKAADAGYRLIVVIAGVHNNLRNQTQAASMRVLSGVTAQGLSAGPDRRLSGWAGSISRGDLVTFTNSVRDFNKVMATGVGVPLQNLTEPAVFVIKKQGTRSRIFLSGFASTAGVGVAA